MKPHDYWKQKVAQFFHDPPGKPFLFFPGAGGHVALAKRLFQQFTSVPLKFVAKFPDFAAAGADRPVVGAPRGTKGALGSVPYYVYPTFTHPLCSFSLVAAAGDDSIPRKLDEIQEQNDDTAAVVADLAELSGFDWGDPDTFPHSMLVLWRRFREELVARHGDSRRGDLLWERMPADSRCPDHSIWEHLKVTSALAFLTKPNKSEHDPACPWLFTLSLGPVQSFIVASRSSRDLWVSSLLLSDLAWHAMLPIVEQYGPEAIIYPDLRGNPRADVWLAKYHPDALPEYLENNPSSFAATLPDTFTAILPRGGEGHLKPLEELARQCDESMQQRWRTLTDCVRDWLGQKLKAAKITGATWREIWDRQVKHVFYTHWSAVPWLVPEPQREFGMHGAFPCQDQAKLKKPNDDDARSMQQRSERLSPWLSTEIWSHYESARNVFGRVNATYLQKERGFDYALTHHQLRVRQQMRKQARPIIHRPDETGEKCVLIPALEALYDESAASAESERTSKSDPTERHRDLVREFWSKLDEDKNGAERLSAVAAVKRFLIEADRDAGLFNHVWAGANEPLDNIRDSDNELRVPFPSTAMLAAQDYLAQLVQNEFLRDELDAVSAAFRQAEIPRTSFARSLPRLAAAARTSRSAAEFLKLDVQTAVFPHVVEARIRYLEERGDGRQAEKYNEVLKPVKHLSEYGRLASLDPPSTRFAVLMLDADHMGRLLLGDPRSVPATWRDVLHPRVVEQLTDKPPLVDAGWPDLLGQRRLIGPALHAFISRALADFAHHVVPWVVEREFGGRLIYAGGDDVLALAPADDAFPIAARLQQIFSAAWVVDTNHVADAWEWRRRDWKGNFDPELDRRRFRIPLPSPRPRDLRDEIDYARHIADPTSQPMPRERVDGRVLAMLGSGASLSASIVYAHFKTPLGDMLRHGRRLLDDVAKERLGRGAVALSHYSRNGPKSEVGLKWSSGKSAGSNVDAQRTLDRVIRGFRDGVLAGRLPYKLRDVAHLAHAAIAPADEVPDVRLLSGLLANAWERTPPRDVRDAVLELWQAGFVAHPHHPERSVDGLLLCRALANRSGNDEEDD